MIGARSLGESPWRFTDDTTMALSIVSVLRRHGQIDQSELALSFGEHYDPKRGYGSSMHSLLPRVRDGEPWREVGQALFGGLGSFGNGAAMRIAPLGAFFADDLPTLIEQARLASEITHTHPEGIAGAIAVAAAAAVDWKFRQAQILPGRSAFLDEILSLIPDSEVGKKVQQAAKLPAGTSVRQAAVKLGNGHRITAQDTVPFVLWCAGEQLDNYEEALWLTASGGGDIDTTCAMVGGIVVMYTGCEAIPDTWRSRREPLPGWAFS